MCHLRRSLTNFLYHRKVMLHSWYIQLFVFLTIRCLTKSVTLMSVSTLDRVHFWMYLLNDNSLTHEIWSVDRCQQGQYFSEIFWVIWKTGTKLQTLFNFATCSNYLITNYVKFPVSFQVSLYYHCNKIIKGPGTSF